MKLVLLGSGGYHPSPWRHTPCALIPECGLMLDAGTGMFRAAQYLATDQLDIFLTHAHLDHVVGLTYLFDILYLHPLRRVVVHGESDKLRAIEEHLFHAELFPTRPPFECRPLAGELEVARGGRVRSFPLDHPGGSVGYRIDWPGRSLALVTDTTASADSSYLDEIRGVDVLLHECYFTDESARWAKKTGHSTLTPVAEIARAADVGRLVLIHINPLATCENPFDLESVRGIFADITVGADLTEVEF